ncbi:MAG: SOS response-associated peptidase [Caldilineales bacterium]|nr:SOS response-associated peptidase [Caldilineales bacterium]
MCGRFTLTASGDELASLFDLEQAPNLEPRYNIAPTQPVAVVRLDREGRRREFTLMRWGLIPSWAKDIHIGNRLINARAETLTEKPAFRTAFRRRRCLIPANGFYEWQKPTAGRKQPYFIGLPDRRPFAFAGLWEHWEGADGSVLDSCAIITTAANERVRVLHDRMPVILERTDFGDWLDPTTTPDRLFHLLRPYPFEMLIYPVSTLVNAPENDRPECIVPLASV